MCEPLRGKRTKKYPDGFQDSDTGDMFWFDDVKSAVEFYKKYRHQPNYCYQEECKNFGFDELAFFEEWFSDDCRIGEIFDDWLFDYCFGDVIDPWKNI